MTALQVQIRDRLHNAVDAYLSTNNIEADPEVTYFPQENREDLVSRAAIKFVIVGFDSIRERLLRDKSLEVVIPIEISLQKVVLPTAVEEIDALVELHENLMSICEDDFDSDGGNSFSWQRTVPRLDDNGLPYSYQQLWQDRIFQATFTSYYKYLKEPGLPAS